MEREREFFFVRVFFFLLSVEVARFRGELRVFSSLTFFFFLFFFIFFQLQADIVSNSYYDWVIDHAFLFVPAQTYVAKMIASLKEFPARQEPASFSIDRVMEKLKAGMPVT